MQKVRILFFLLLGLCWFSGQSILYAQDYDDEDIPYEQDYDDEDEDDDNEDIPYEAEWDGYMPEYYARGDQTFTISLGLIFPAVFVNNGTVINHRISPPVGGAGLLAYSYFLNSHLFIGGEIGAQFLHTIGKNTVFFIPIGLRAGWQFLIKRFEIPLTFTIGFVPHRYLNYNYVGLFLKGGASAYFRFNPDWSFGINTDWSWYPQWPKENGKPAPQKNVDANIIGLTLCARYHF